MTGFAIGFVVTLSAIVGDITEYRGVMPFTQEVVATDKGLTGELELFLSSSLVDKACSLSNIGVSVNTSSTMLSVLMFASSLTLPVLPLDESDARTECTNGDTLDDSHSMDGSVSCFNGQRGESCFELAVDSKGLLGGKVNDTRRLRGRLAVGGSSAISSSDDEW